MDFNFYGHQLSAHYCPQECKDISKNDVDGDKVPVRHFGIVLEWNVWEELAEKFKYYLKQFSFLFS